MQIDETVDDFLSVEGFLKFLITRISRGHDAALSIKLIYWLVTECESEQTYRLIKILLEGGLIEELSLISIESDSMTLFYIASILFGIVNLALHDLVKPENEYLIEFWMIPLMRDIMKQPECDIHAWNSRELVMIIIECLLDLRDKRFDNLKFLLNEFSASYPL